MRTLHLGPEELLVAAKIAVQHDDTAPQVADAINAAEARIREAVPIARVIYLEPDIYRAAGPTGEPRAAQVRSRTTSPREGPASRVDGPAVRPARVAAYGPTRAARARTRSPAPVARRPRPLSTARHQSKVPSHRGTFPQRRYRIRAARRESALRPPPSQPLPEPGVHQLPRQQRQDPQMLVARRGLRHRDHEHQPGLRTVQSAPLDALRGPGEPDDRRGHRVRLGVRDGDLLAEPGRALLLPGAARPARAPRRPAPCRCGRALAAISRIGGLLVVGGQLLLDGPRRQIPGEHLGFLRRASGAGCVGRQRLRLRIRAGLGLAIALRLASAWSRHRPRTGSRPRARSRPSPRRPP